jgi:hypothetical protein
MNEYFAVAFEFTLREHLVRKEKSSLWDELQKVHNDRNLIVHKGVQIKYGSGKTAYRTIEETITFLNKEF